MRILGISAFYHDSAAALLIDGRPVAVMSNDFTVLGASSSVVNGKKIRHLKETATRKGMPFVLLGESSGARMPWIMRTVVVLPAPLGPSRAKISW